MELLVNAALSALVNIVILVVIPFACYWLWHRLRHRRTFAEVARRAGLQCGDQRYLLYAAGLTVLAIGALLLFPPPLEIMSRKGSAQHEFVGLGLSGTTVLLALIYGMIKTGFAEEFLFRGLIAGSLGRRLPLWWAVFLQALIFLLPHLFLLKVMPELWQMLPLMFVGMLVAGWLRIRSGSIVGPWLLHGALNVTMALLVAAGTTGQPALELARWL